MVLSEEYYIDLQACDSTPKNFKSLDNIVAMVENKLKEKSNDAN